jgi:hypothetical protein
VLVQKPILTSNTATKKEMGYQIITAKGPKATLLPIRNTEEEISRTTTATREMGQSGANNSRESSSHALYVAKRDI